MFVIFIKSRDKADECEYEYFKNEEERETVTCITNSEFVREVLQCISEKFQATKPQHQIPK